MVGQFPHAFTKQVACESYIEILRDDIDTTIKIFTQFGEMDAKVDKYKLGCEKSESGEPI